MEVALNRQSSESAASLVADEGAIISATPQPCHSPEERTCTESQKPTDHREPPIVVQSSNTPDQSHGNVTVDLASAEPRRDTKVKGRQHPVDSRLHEQSLAQSINALSLRAQTSSTSSSHDVTQLPVPLSSSPSSRGLISKTAVSVLEPQDSSRALRIATVRSKSVQGLRAFSRAIEDEVQSHFEAVKGALQDAIVKYLVKKRVDFRPLAIHLRVLGRTEEDAKPTIAVLCSEAARKLAEKCVKKDFVRAIYNGSDTRGVNFECVVIGRLKPKADEVADEVFVERLPLAGDETWTPRIKVMQSGVAQLATLGGFLCVVNDSGTKSVFGLTVGHILLPRPLYDDDTQPMSGSEDGSSSVGSDGDSETTASTVEDEDAALCQDTWDDPAPADGDEGTESSDWIPLGRMARASYSERARDRDWALVEIQTLPKSQFQAGLSRNVPFCRYEGARASDTDIVSIGNRSENRYHVSKKPVSAVLPSGRAFAFVDMQVLDSVDGRDLPDGTSGSWVVAPGIEEIYQVYGMLVAEDPLGSLWMVPMIDILSDIKQELNAGQVSLVAFSEALSIAKSNDRDVDTPIDCFAPAANFMATLSDRTPPDRSMSDLNAAFSGLSLSSASSSSTRRIEPWRHPIDVVSAPSYVPRPAGNLYTNAFQGVAAKMRNSSRHREEDSGPTASLGDGLLWFCGHCYDGPYPGWQVSCMSCLRIRDDDCIVYEDPVAPRRK